jgi:hypothetical protein
MMATFPEYACVLLEGYQEKANYSVLRTEMDSGIPKQRPRRSLPMVVRDVKVKVANKTEKASFDAWIKDDIFGGTAWFDYTDPIDNVVKQARIVSGDVTWSSPGVVWFADMKLETVG